jgi:type IV secretion system protein TrbJ
MTIGLALRSVSLRAGAMASVLGAASPGFTQTIVYDPSNYEQNALQAARSLQQINNQITSLQNQTQMLLNQARNLTSLPYSTLQSIEQSLTRTQQLLNQAQRVKFDSNQIDQAFQHRYPQTYTGSISSQQLMGDAQARWQDSLAAHQDALRVQAGVVQSLDMTRSQTNGLVSSSQSAVGILQATQAGNQLIALQTRQLADLTALLAAHSRMQSLEGARLNANQEQAREQLSRFLNNGQGYQPQMVQMFHQ